MRVEDLTFTKRRELVTELRELGFKRADSFYRKEKISISFKCLDFVDIRYNSGVINIYTAKGIISLYSNLTVIM